MKSIAGTKRPEDALGHLAAELDEGRIGVIVITVDADRMVRLTMCGDCSRGDVAFAALHMQHRALMEDE